eukprot:jgi/Galph1/5295/GphlegSOOS_G3956.1
MWWQTSTPVICAGMHAIDLLLINSDTPATPESVVFFEKYIHYPGGSVYNTARGLVQLGIPTKVLTRIGNDENGKRFLEELAQYEIDSSDIKIDSQASTCFCILPVYRHGGRGAFSHLGANTSIQREDLLDAKLKQALEQANTNHSNPPYLIYHYGYPHMIPQVQGKLLAEHLQRILSIGMTTVLDMNGANSNDEAIVHAAFLWVGILHVNIEEAIALSGIHRHYFQQQTKETPLEDQVTFQDVTEIANYFHQQGVALVAITLGARGAFLSTHSQSEILSRNIPCFPYLPINTQVFRPSFQSQGTIQGVGAGDTFTAGILAMLIYQRQKNSQELSLELLTDVGLIAALQRIDSGRTAKELPQLLEELPFLTRAVVKPLS